MATLSPAQRAAAAQQLQAQYAHQYNPSNVPPPGPGMYVGPYFQTNDGKWYRAPETTEGKGQFVPSAPPPDGFSTLPPPPPQRANIGTGIPGPRFNMPGSSGAGFGGEGGVDLSGDFGRPLGTRGLGNVDFSRPNLTTPPTPTSPTPETTDEKDKGKDKGFDWKKVLAALLGGSGDIASVLSAAAQQRANARAAEAVNARDEDRLALQRAQFALTAPRARAGQAAYGDYLANVQDININVPGVPQYSITGGGRPSNLGPNARAAGTELSKQALEKLLSGEDLPPSSERPESNWIDDLLNYSSTALTGAAIYNRIRNPNPTPTRTSTVAAPRPVGSSAQGILDTGQRSAFNDPNWFMPRAR